MPFDLATYLDRIGLEKCPADLSGLKKLQTAQISSIPFENVLPFSGKVPDLDPDVLWQKLVRAKCGGYCFEVNSLLGQALNALGFPNRQVLARVRMGEPRGGARTHLAFVVPLDGDEWLVDAGFGGQAPAAPVKIVPHEEQPIRDQIYRIRFEDHSGEHVLERKTETGWFPLYGFDRVDVRREDIEAANFVCALSPMQSFAGSLKFYRLTQTGFFSFLNGRARCVDGGESREWQIREEAELRDFMKTDLGLGYDDPAIQAIADRLRSLF
ncbi:arylamine N-acetyltransferase [Roseibium sp. MMSF_3412]|uniref:arylamine N-acetyltransferase family protein n=1 Tax=Roseibium sp. MMSF_3412 TaxID=3046712 RepID=UPI00273EED15|nr:arylamine N-acetyltransferase [Roseibium sp. MMSF_3412]